MKTRVVAVTVTFNSSHYIKRAIEALVSQTYPVEKIIVVDNNSKETDYVKLQELNEKYEQVEFVWLKENSGGAGGFQAGMQYAYERYDPEWYWIMDDDAFPRQECLERLMEHQGIDDKVGFLAPLIYGIDKNEYQLYHHKNMSKYLDYEFHPISNLETMEDIVSIEATAFAGPVISKQAIETVGVADGELFIYGDDTEYTYRVTRQFKGYIVKNAIINHQDPPENSGILSPKTWWKDYYMYRNRLLFVNLYRGNFIYELIGKILITFRIIKQIIKAGLRKEYKGYKLIRAKILLKALFDGVNKKKGKRIDPAVYIQTLNNLEIQKGH